MSAEYFITREEIIDAQKKARELRAQGISVPWQLLVAVKEPELVIAGVSRDYFNIIQPTQFVARPRRYKVYKNYIVFRYQNGVKAALPLPDDPKERMAAFQAATNGIHLVRRIGGRWRVKVLEAHVDLEAARRAVEEHGWTQVLGWAVGLTADAARARWWRFLPLMLGIHIIELSEAGTGKTHHWLALSRALNVVYMNEAPTATFLIADMRTGEVGAVGTADILVIDELDKVDFSDTWAYQLMLSGMENGVWARAAGTGFVVERTVSVVMQGNCGRAKRVDVPCTNKPRQDWESVLSKVIKQNAKPLVDRTAVIAAEADPIAQSDIADRMLKPQVTRGLFQLLNSMYEVKEYTGNIRRDKQISAVDLMLKIFNIEKDPVEVWERGP